MSIEVEELMTKCLVTVAPTETIGGARRRLRESRVRHLPVVSADDRLVGILSDRDLLGTSHADDALVAAVMTASPLTVFTDTPAYEAAAVMLQQTFGCLPVIDTERRLLGLLTASDLLMAVHGLLLDEEAAERVEKKSLPQLDSVHIEHAALRALVERLRGARYPETVVAALAELGSFFERHFEREEGEGGFFAQLRSRAPDLAPELDVLAGEHRRMLASIAALAEQHRILAEAGSVDVSAGVAGLVATIERHEAKEAELMRTAFA